MSKKQQALNKSVKRKMKRDQQESKRKRTLIIAGSILGVIVLAVVGFFVYRAITGSTPIVSSSSNNISGTVTYSGSQPTGRVYVKLTDSTGADTGMGTSMASPGSYTIHNVPDGSYVLHGWMDITNPQIAIPNALTPSGSLSVAVNNANLTGQTIDVTDPSPTPSPGAPSNVVVGPGNGSALVEWSAPQDSSGNTLAQYYNIYYSTDSGVDPTTGIKNTVQANTSDFISGLTDGTTYYFVITAVLGGVESDPSDPASITAGTVTGSNTISGQVFFSVTPTGPLYVGVSGQSGTFFQRIDKPVSPQSYSITGVPMGTYTTFTLLDMNNDGAIDIGDLNKSDSAPNGGNTTIDVNGDMTGANRMLFVSNVLARVITIHFNSDSSPGTDLYSLEYEIRGNLKLPVNITLTSGKNVPVPADLGGNYNYYHLIQTVDAKPAVGDSYKLAITYSDGTSENLSLPLTAELDSFAQNLTISGADPSTPTFNWSAPASPPLAYTYFIQVGESGIGQEWTYPQSGSGMPPTQTSVVYNTDGRASLTTLQRGTKYDWIIYVMDSSGNQAIYATTYTP